MTSVQAAGDSRRRLRKAWFQVHKWIALVLMILLIPLGLSGVVLAWDDSIDHALNPHRYAVSGTALLPPSAYVDAVRRATDPGERIANIRYPDADGGPVTVMASPPAPTGKGPKKGEDQAQGGDHQRGEDRHRGGPPVRVMLWLDPPTARVLDTRIGDTGLVRIAHNFHGSLFIPGAGVGRALVGLLGTAMFLMAATGIWLWWPPMGRWSRGLRWDRGDRRLDSNLHHRVGFWICLPLAFQAFTGVWIASPQMLSMVGLGGPAGGLRQRPQPMDDVQQAPDAVLAAAQKLASGSPAMIAWPMKGVGAWTVTLSGAHDRPAAIAVDDETGEPQQAKPDGGEGGAGLAGAIRRLHDGTTLGPWWRAFMVLTGLSPTLLGITGLTMWLRTRRWRGPKRRQHVPDAEAGELVA